MPAIRSGVQRVPLLLNLLCSTPLWLTSIYSQATPTETEVYHRIGNDQVHRMLVSPSYPRHGPDPVIRLFAAWQICRLRRSSQPVTHP